MREFDQVIIYFYSQKKNGCNHLYNQKDAFVPVLPVDLYIKLGYM